ncbi:hypothetical protein [Mucilaginibacter sp. OK098]|uniref:hypothetical protein n=1 Tax=Mucilaginibacter sp. OK098 TaxID=1855297 RepID=UPI000910AFD1|nr:hypothetical protein [Mucilaginibacter sp. OK098]SHM50581.1 hypothetical protein SAMN05216524_102327 [Mucilaginibacter sp. OK098]
MKTMFTKLFSAALLASLIVGYTAKAQTTSLNADAATTVAISAPAAPKTEVKTVEKAKAEEPVATVKKEVKAAEDTSWKPQRRLWGYAFGDFYYNAHSPATSSSQGKENNYTGVPTGRNAFQFRRLYLGYDYDITKKFKAEVLLASEPSANTGVNGTTSIQNSDNLVDGKMSFYIKNFNIRVRDLWNGTDLVVGEMSTPTFALNEPGTNAPTSLAEATWSYRSIERTITDFHKDNSYDVGAALQGTFDPKTKNFGYVAMVGNNSTASLLSAANANTGFYKIFYGTLWGKFLDKKLYVDFYADYAQTAPNTAAVGAQSHNMYKVFAAYNAKYFTIGAEAYTQKFKNGVTNKTTALAEDAKAEGLSLWIRGAIVQGKWGYFARWDTYNPDTQFNSGDPYSVNTNYGSYDPTTKEQFVTLGLDFTPAKNIHFMPNIWFTQYKDKLAPTTAGYLPDNHTLVYRMTFFFTFGK